MPTPIDTTMMTDITNTDETSSMPSTSTSPPSSSPPSILSTIKFQQMIKQQQQFENDPGINIGHITVSHNGYVIMLSGFKGYKENSTAFYRPSEEIWIYDQMVEKWIKKTCKTESGDKDDDMPLERSNACATIINNDYLYMFGGFSEEGNLNTLHRLNLCTLKWQRIRPDVSDLCSFEPLPCDKNVCWEYDDKFYLFGGYGPVPRIWNENYQFQFIFDQSSHWHYIRGWNNQLVYYDPDLNQWKWPKQSGQIPTARAACAASKIDHQHYVYLFGGRMNRERMNDMYRLDMRTMCWTMIQSNNINHPVRGRSWHTLTPVSDQMLVLYGGFSHDNQPLKDCWIFDTRSYTWREIILPFEKPRFWHSATLSTFGEILGGATKELISSYHRNPKYNHIFAKDMFTIKFQPQSLFRICLSTISTNLQLSEQLFHILPLNLLEIVFKRCFANNDNDLRIQLQKINDNIDHHDEDDDDDDQMKP
uniref:Kelch domain-containing protein 2-like n=1 Tax=Dermatophagoides pteronyssinus TaxID=6956 RepID=A0A6P6YAF4_DERPT|nr:kelch domain-containing protein 2-like [Dermatophagoides pteronyssinus]